MINKITQFIGICLVLLSCNGVPRSEYNQLQTEFHKAYERNTELDLVLDSLMVEIDFLKNGAPKVLNEIKQLSDEEKWESVLSEYKKLRSNFPQTFELRDAKSYADRAQDEIAWSRSKGLNEVHSYESYIDQFPQGKYVSNAREQIVVRKREVFAERLQNAKRTNSAYAWRSFLNDYPEYQNRKNIEKKIIDLEVDEIFANQSTGRLPQSNRIGGYGSSSSSVRIQNSTQYELILRYSGASTKKVSISPHRQKTVTLSSGSYRVAASAGGLNYAGSESLFGDYDVKYYISSY